MHKNTHPHTHTNVIFQKEIPNLTFSYLLSMKPHVLVLAQHLRTLRCLKYLIFESHDPKLKIYRFPLKNFAISKIPDFPSCNDKYFHEKRQTQAGASMYNSSNGVISIVPGDSQFLPAGQCKRTVKEQMRNILYSLVMAHHTVIIRLHIVISPLEHRFGIQSVHQNLPHKKFEPWCTFGFPNPSEGG